MVLLSVFSGLVEGTVHVFWWSCKLTRFILKGFQGFVELEHRGLDPYSV